MLAFGDIYPSAGASIHSRWHDWLNSRTIGVEFPISILDNFFAADGDLQKWQVPPPASPEAG